MQPLACPSLLPAQTDISHERKQLPVRQASVLGVQAPVMLEGA